MRGRLFNLLAVVSLVGCVGMAFLAVFTRHHLLAFIPLQTSRVVGGISLLRGNVALFWEWPNQFFNIDDPQPVLVCTWASPSSSFYAFPRGGFGVRWGQADAVDSGVQVSLWLIAAVFAVATAWSIRRVLRATRESMPAGLCPSCGYDLRASPERCPECGAVPFAGDSLAVGAEKMPE